MAGEGRTEWTGPRRATPCPEIRGPCPTGSGDVLVTAEAAKILWPRRV